MITTYGTLTAALVTPDIGIPLAAGFASVAFIVVASGGAVLALSALLSRLPAHDPATK